MLARLRDALTGLIDWITEQFAIYLKAVPVAGASVLPFEEREGPATEMDVLARTVASYVLAAAALVISFIPWVSQELTLPVVDLMMRIATFIAV
jgi:hypothetical protein